MRTSIIKHLRFIVIPVPPDPQINPHKKSFCLNHSQASLNTNGSTNGTSQLGFEFQGKWLVVGDNDDDRVALSFDDLEEVCLQQVMVKHDDDLGSLPRFFPKSWWL